MINSINLCSKTINKCEISPKFCQVLLTKEYNQHLDLFFSQTLEIYWDTYQHFITIIQIGP